MPKEVTTSISVPNCTVQQYHSAVYGDSTAVCRYHKEVNKNDTATASPWVDGKREVVFQMAIAVPAVIQKMVGAGPISVKEAQRLTWHSNSSFTVHSSPVLDFPGSSKFTTEAEITVSSDGAAGTCKAVALIKCTAGLPWPMASSVEAIMVEQARASVAEYLAHCAKVCAEHASGRAAPPAVAAAASRRHTEADDEFFDALETASVLSLGLDHHHAGSAGAGASGMAGLLSVMQAQLASTTAVLQGMDASLKSLDTTFKSIDATLQLQSRRSGRGWAALYVAAAAGAAAAIAHQRGLLRW